MQLTSHEKGVTEVSEPRCPVFVPVGIGKFDIGKFAHVEMLAATTNFVKVVSEDLDEGDLKRIVDDVKARVSVFKK